MIESEIRAIVSDKKEIIDRLVSIGFSFTREITQHDIMFDKDDASLFRAGYKIRMRIEDKKKEMTYKGNVNKSSEISIRREINIPICSEASIEECILFFEALGYSVCFQIKKIRTIFSKDDIYATLDEWPIIGCMVEIEGDQDVIVDIAKQIAPDIKFSNYRLSQFFEGKIYETGKSLQQLKDEYYEKTGFDLGKIELIM